MVKTWARQIPEWRRLQRLADDAGATGVLTATLLRSARNLTMIDVHAMTPLVLKHTAITFAACSPIALFYGWLAGVFTVQYVPHVAAPGRLVMVGIVPMALFISGLIFVQRDGVLQAETYAVDTRESGFQYLLDLGLHPLIWIVVPRIVSSAMALGVLAASTVLAILVGISPATVVGLDTHSAIPVGVTARIIDAGIEGSLFGLWFGFAAFVAGVTGDNEEPGSASRKFIFIAAASLINILLLELYSSW